MALDLAFLGQHKLEVYSSHGCPDCSRLDRWMKDNSVAHAKVYIDEVDAAADKLENETGKQAVPFILVDGQRWVRGYHKEERSRFNEAKLIEELKQTIAGP